MELLEYIRYLQYHELQETIFVETDDGKYDVYESSCLKVNGEECSEEEFYEFFRSIQNTVFCNGKKFKSNGLKYIGIKL